MERDVATMIIARNIEALIKQKGTNAAVVADKAGLGPTGVYDIIKGKSRNPRIDTIRKIAVDGLGVPLATLFTEPSEDGLKQRMDETFGMLDPEARKRFLRLARALLTDEGRQDQAD